MSVNRLSFHNGHLSNDSRKLYAKRFKVDSESKYSYRNRVESIETMMIEGLTHIKLVVRIMYVICVIDWVILLLIARMVKCYACSKKGHIARHCSLNRPHSSYSLSQNKVALGVITTIVMKVNLVLSDLLRIRQT